MARRTFQDYQDQVLHALGNPDPADMTIPPGDIVNDALEHLASLHPWRWLQTSQTELDLVEDQPWVQLPIDYGTFVAAEFRSSIMQRLVPVTAARLLQLRAGAPVPPLGGYYYLIHTGAIDPDNPEDGLLAPRMELFPTPSSNEAGAIMLVYHRLLRRMEDPDDVPQWPVYMDRLLSLLARGFASTDYDDDPTSAYTVEFSQMLPDVMAKDGLAIGSFGQMKRTVDRGRRINWAYPFRIPPFS